MIKPLLIQLDKLSTVPLCSNLQGKDGQKSDGVVYIVLFIYT